MRSAGHGIPRGLNPGRPVPTGYRKVAVLDPPSPAGSAQPPPTTAASTNAALIMTNYTSAAQLVIIHVCEPVLHQVATVKILNTELAGLF